MVTARIASNTPQIERVYGMGITVSDLRRAMLGGGDVSSLAGVCHRALGSPPLPITSQFNEPLVLPDSQMLSNPSGERVGSDFSHKGIGGNEKDIVKRSALAGVNLTLVPLVPYGKNISRFLQKVIVKTQPDTIAVDLCPIELGAQILYTFSFLSALGLPLQASIHHQDTQEEFLNKSFYPGNMAETAILESWLDKIPLMSVGRPSRPRRLEYIAEQGVIDLDQLENPHWETNLSIACRAIDETWKDTASLEEGILRARELSLSLTKTLSEKMRESVVDDASFAGSRILDVASRLESRNRILVLVDIAHYMDLEYILGLLQQGILEEIYAPSENNHRLQNNILVGQVSEKLYMEAQDYIPETTLSQELFHSELERYTAFKDSEILPEAESHQLTVDIANRTRIHPEIIRGVSVRGSIAFEEIARGLSEISGGLNRDVLARAAMITLPPRITLKQKGKAAAIVHDITLEALYGVSFSGSKESVLSQTLKRLAASDILANLNPLAQSPGEEKGGLTENRSPAVVSETDQNREALKRLEDMRFLKKDERGQYQLTKKALEYMLSDLDQKLKEGQITQEEYRQQKSSLMKALRHISEPQYQISSKELADTVMEMMDAQDKLWEKEVNFSTLHVYYHIKENSEGATLIPQKRDYQALKKLIDDLDKRKILMAAEKSSGFVLTGIALNLLLQYLIDKDKIGRSLKGIIGMGKALTQERKSEIRRYSAGDAFRDISVRHTLKEIVRQKKDLSGVRNSDFRVYQKQRRDSRSDIIICLDTSGSMGFHQKMTYARLAAAGLAKAAMAEGNRVGLVAFNDFGQVTVPLTEKDPESLLNCIAATTPRGNTNIGDGIKSSIDLLFQSFSSNQKFIILITDGQPTAISESVFTRLKGVKERDLTEESALLETRRAAARGARLSVIHVAAAAEASGDFIKDIARAGKGKIRRISSADDLKMAMK